VAKVLDRCVRLAYYQRIASVLKAEGAVSRYVPLEE